MKSRGEWFDVTVVMLLALLGLVAPEASAQTGAAALIGTVRDPNQAPVPGAQVTITDTETNVSHQTQSSDAGIYFFGALPRGPYTLVVEKEGFKKWETELVLRVGQNMTVDPALEIGSVRTTVEVKGAAPTITTGSIEVSNVKDFERIRQLPLNGRSIGNLFALTP